MCISIVSTFLFVHPSHMFHRVISATYTWICICAAVNFLIVFILLLRAVVGYLNPTISFQYAYYPISPIMVISSALALEVRSRLLEIDINLFVFHFKCCWNFSTFPGHGAVLYFRDSITIV